MPAKENESAKQTEAEATEAAASTGSPKSSETGEALDFANMDLSVESVEERISPSETNVFDK